MHSKRKDSTTDLFFGEMLRSAKSRARREVSSELRDLKKERTVLRRELKAYQDRDSNKRGFFYDKEQQLNKREKALVQKEKRFNVREQELRVWANYLLKIDERIKEVKTKPIGRVIHDYKGCDKVALFGKCRKFAKTEVKKK